jgi:DNA-binding Lrp family transcriptional regulator
MLRAYLLIQTEIGRAANVAKDLAAISGITDVSAVDGPYDVIAVAEAAGVDDLGYLIMERVQAITGLTRMLTCPVVRL